MVKVFGSILSVFVLVLSVAAPTAAYAQSSGAGEEQRSISDIIMSGLRAGANLDFGDYLKRTLNDSSTSTATSKPTSPRSNSVPPENTYPQNTTNTMDTTVSTKGAYVALGDSVAAGVGLDEKVPVPISEKRCGRTTDAYAYPVSRVQSLPLIFLACSGATAGDLVTKQRTGSPNQPPQLDRAFATGVPALITITAGANDVRWDRFLITCRYYDCTTKTQTAITETRLTILSGKLHYVLNDIQLRSGSTPPIVVITGYYNPVSSACTATYPGITEEEVAAITSRVAELNQVIQDAASLYTFVRFAPVDFSGHDICSADPWVQGREDSRPIHPTAEGQREIARSVLRVVNQ